MRLAISCLIVVLLATAVFANNSTDEVIGKVSSNGYHCANKRFIFNRAELSWDKADLECYSHGFKFASIRSQKELNDFIKARTDAGLLTEEFWISGYDHTMTRKFKWMDNPVAELDYTNWGIDEPPGDLEKQCVFVSLVSSWFTDICVRKRMFVCATCS